MARYIDADELKQKLQERSTNHTTIFINTVLLGFIDKAPTANVAPMEEVERLQNILDSYIVQYGTVAHKEVLLKKERADTVKKMRERLYRELAFLGAKDKFNKEYFLTEVDRVAKEILEGKDGV
jgi:hypothetical protein